MKNDFFPPVFLFTALELPLIHAHIHRYLKPETQKDIFLRVWRKKKTHSVKNVFWRHGLFDNIHFWKLHLHANLSNQIAQ